MNYLHVSDRRWKLPHQVVTTCTNNHANTTWDVDSFFCEFNCKLMWMRYVLKSNSHNTVSNPISVGISPLSKLSFRLNVFNSVIDPTSDGIWPMRLLLPLRRTMKFQVEKTLHLINAITILWKSFYSYQHQKHAGISYFPCLTVLLQSNHYVLYVSN